jgi:predicted dehydrogenase
MRRRFGIARLHRTWQDLVSDVAIDGVLVATPAHEHATIAQGVLTAGKHVLVEKPLSLTLPEAETLAVAAKGSGLVAMVGLNSRFHPLVRSLRDAIARGDLGKPLAAFVTLTSMREQRKSVTGYEIHPRLGGGVFYDKVVHVLDVLRFLFDCEAVAARATCKPETHAHDFASLSLEMENGVQVSGICSDRMFPDFTCLVLGDAGKAMINLTRPTGLLLYRKAFARDRFLKMSGYARQMLHIAGTVSYFATARGRLSSYRTQWETFIHGVSTQTTPRPNFEDGVAIARTLQQLLASAETNE